MRGGTGTWNPSRADFELQRGLLSNYTQGDKDELAWIKRKLDLTATSERIDKKLDLNKRALTAL